MVMFMALPFGATPPEEVGQGHSSGAPAKTHLGIKAMVTSVLAALITWAFFYFTSGILVVAE
jgi:predicted secreted protein